MLALPRPILRDKSSVYTTFDAFIHLCVCVSQGPRLQRRLKGPLDHVKRGDRYRQKAYSALDDRNREGERGRSVDIMHPGLPVSASAL